MSHRAKIVNLYNIILIFSLLDLKYYKNGHVMHFMPKDKKAYLEI